MAVHIDVEYRGGGFKTVATHGPSGVTIATVPPVDNQGDGSSFSPTDLCATAYATCMITILAMAAKKHGHDVAGARVRVEKHMSAELPRRIARLSLTLTIPGGVPADLRPRLEDAARNCPVALSLGAGVETPIDFVWLE